ncbi:MAG: hypothetical protein NC313_06865 [Butyrivibrio sp.]|nr:hypothetical protein [Butyrivibrio sp.]
MARKIKHFTAGIILAIIGFFFMSIMARFVSKNLLFEALDMNNSLVQAIWWDYSAGLIAGRLNQENGFNINLDIYDEEYSWGDNALMTVTNLNDESGKSVLLIQDSYGDVVAPFMALGVSKLYDLDIRTFSGNS